MPIRIFERIVALTFYDVTANDKLINPIGYIDTKYYTSKFQMDQVLIWNETSGF